MCCYEWDILLLVLISTYKDILKWNLAQMKGGVHVTKLSHWTHSNELSNSTRISRFNIESRKRIAIQWDKICGFDQYEDSWV